MGVTTTLPLYIAAVHRCQESRSPLLAVQQIEKFSPARMIGEGMATNLPVVMQLRFGPPDENTAQRVELADTVPQPLDSISLPHDFTLKCWNPVLAPTQVVKVRGYPERVWLDPIYV